MYKRSKAKIISMSELKKIIPKKTIGKPCYCLKCATPYSEEPKDKLCAKCKGQTHCFDSALEGDRFIDLFRNPKISDIIPQYEFKKNLPEAIYEHGRGIPTLKGYRKERNENKVYKIDFVYRDLTCFREWVAEELKPNPDGMRLLQRTSFEKSKSNLVDAYDQHKSFGHFVLTYPDKQKKGFIRKFVTRPNKAVKYVDYEELINH